MKQSDGFTVFCIDDEPESLNSYRRVLRRIVDHLYCFSDAEKALEELKNTTVQLMLLDLQMPFMNGHDVLKRVKGIESDLNVIIVTGRGTIGDAVKAIKNGADDVLEKPISNEMLASRVGHFRRLWELENETVTLRKQAERKFDYDQLVGISEAMLRLKQTVVNVGPTDLSVLIQGATGTGKEIVARAIHAHSDRCNGPFVVVDCGALSDSVIESELFGYRKGAFTGADSPHSGLFQEAEGGTVFLDEIGELPLLLQTKLLRVVQEQEIRPVGETRTVTLDIRVLAASNRNLLNAAEDGSFREDLYYRLSTITLNVPSLKERVEDIPGLIAYFLEQHSFPPDNITGIEKSALELMMRYPWPGNVRELENIIRRAIVFAEPPRIQLIDLPESIRGDHHAGKEIKTDGSDNNGEGKDKNRFLIENYEILAIEDALKQTGGNKKEAAQLLGISEATIHRKLKRMGKSL